MSNPGVSYQRGRGRAWGVVLAIIAGVIIFFALVELTAGYLLALLFAVIAMVIVGACHYLVWGRAMAEHVPAGTLYMPPTGRLQKPVAQFSMSLDDKERAALLRLLTQLDVRQEEGTPLSPQDDALVRRLRDRLSNYGA